MLRYIRKAYIMEAYHLSTATVRQWDGVAVIDSYMPWKQLPTVGLSALSVTESVENGLCSKNVKFTCTLSEWQHLPRRPACLKLVCTDGTEWLMGRNLRPYPQLTQELSRPDRVSERTICTLTVQLTGSGGLMGINELVK